MTRNQTARRPSLSHTLRRASSRPKRHTALRRRVRAASPLHIRFALHPLSLFALLVAGVLMAGWTLHAGADSYTVHAKVPAPPLTDGAVITSPADGTVTSSNSIVVTGTCPSNSYVTLARNNLFSGVSACAGDNTFTITTALSAGDNSLVAQDYNITDDPGPTTPGIVVRYNPPQQGGGGSSGSGSSGSSSGSGSSTPPAQPLLLVSDYRFQAVESGTAFHWTINLRGGTAPYTLVIDWGDDGETVQTARSSGDVTISHNYTAPGYFTIVVNVTDAAGSTTTLQLVAFVKTPGSGILFQNGNASGPASSGNALLDALTASKWLLVAWPSYAVVTLMVASFWLGERQEIHRLLSGQRLRTHAGRR